MVGLNFANEQEAERFGNAVETKINERVEKKRASSSKCSRYRNTSLPPLSLSLSLSALKAAGAGGGGGVGGNVPAEMIGKPPSKVTPITDRNDPFAGKTGKPKRPKGRKINKADIGLPSDFR
jgi:hypothetical protein